MGDRRLIFQTMESGVIKSYIWTFINRFLHYFLILTFALSYLSADIDTLFLVHIVCGVLFGAGVILRVIWGFIGTKHSRFWDFNYRGILEYLTSILGNKKHYIGHNPASSVAIILMLGFGFLVVFSGLLQYGAEQNSGIFAPLFFTYSYFYMGDDLHEFFANCLLFIVAIHFCGSLIDKFWSKGDAIDSMLNGYKRTQKDESVSLNPAQKAIFAFFLLFLFALFLYLLYPKNILLRPSEQDFFTQDSNKTAFGEYKQECGSCHIAYAPFLLPKSAWDSMMSDLENHFGDDASLEEETHARIAAFLEKYASDVVNTKFTQQKESQQIAITKTPYWEIAHRKLNPKIFTTKAIKSKANCQTCHKDAESGIFAKNAVEYFKLKSLRENL
ncbi:cytochrome b/b6 domain-containing protein [Helicobacter sp. UBA3407]|uniref:cytochrome b/b6 domain-containing protein n=1 Tax=Helicobacter TaxID=209 RepID=UPI0026039E08|nr:cytochrome b/b6 domain-containing protein [Helicobacter sp. UBA3407]